MTFSIFFSASSLQLGAADAEIKVPFAKTTKFPKFPSFKPGVGQSISLYLSPTSAKSAFLIAAFPVPSTSFFHSPLST